MLNLSSITKPVRNLSGYVRPDGSPAEESIDNDDIIEFVAPKELYGAIPEPVPANKVLPDWYKSLGQYTTNDPNESQNDRPALSSSTVKRCAPFMEAMTLGWIITLPAEVHFRAESGRIQYEWEFGRELVSNHSMGQVGGEAFPNNDWPVLKFHNYWSMKVPDGYSALIIDPMNRPGRPFETFSGVVDIDNYFNNVNAPFMWTGRSQEVILEDGSPMFQVIPFRRDALINTGIVREMTEEEQLEQKRTQIGLSSHTSLYRDERWQKKSGSRNIPAEVVKEADEEGSLCPFHRG